MGSENLRIYLDEHYEQSVFDRARVGSERWTFYCHSNKVYKGIITKNSPYEIGIHDERARDIALKKLEIQFMVPAQDTDSYEKNFKIDKAVAGRALDPIEPCALRHHVKNKTLFPLMEERRVVYLTTLEGKIIRGLIIGFTRYEITVAMKDHIAVTVMRHALYDLRDKNGTSYLKKAVIRRQKAGKTKELKSPEPSGFRHRNRSMPDRAR